MRVLVLTHRLPYAPNRGDRIRAFHILLELARHYEVDLVSLVHDAEEASHAHDLDKYGIRTTIAPVSRIGNLVRAVTALPGATPLTHALLASADVARALDAISRTRPPDVVLAYCSGMAQYALAPPLSGIPLVLDMVDVDSEKWRALAALAAQPKRWIYAREQRTLSAFERRASDVSVVTLVVNDRERELLLSIAPSAPVQVVPNGVDVEAFRPTGPPAAAPVAVFCGVMNYEPNAAAARWVAEEVWPLVLAKEPQARLLLVGASPQASVRALASASVTVTGSVPDTRPYLWEAAVGLAPLHTARGIQNKVLEAIAAGLPTVVTPAVAAGLPNEVSLACTTAATPASFASAILDLFAATPDARRAIAGRADLVPLTWAPRLAPLRGLIEHATAQNTSRTTSFEGTPEPH